MSNEIGSVRQWDEGDLMEAFRLIQSERHTGDDQIIFAEMRRRGGGGAREQRDASNRPRLWDFEPDKPLC
ncbi:hypothetical protein VHN57_26750 [Sphingobium sp. WW5]|jgi:hypothetical protein|uniref:hypothetical protein n=1 Tax=unclassified Sphingobium TaxID=2611147 RepID=UPI003C24BF0E